MEPEKNIKPKSNKKNKVNKQKKNNKNKAQNTKPKVNKKIENMNGLLELRRLLVEENIVTGYYEDCVHKSFTNKVSFYPCPWDSRILNDNDSSANCGCYYNCSKNNNKILGNKEIYMKAIDRLISNLKEDPKWGLKDEPRKGLLDVNDKKQIDLWQRKKQEEDDRRFKEEEKHRKENEVEMIGCPPEFIKDLKTLSDTRMLNLGEDYLFLEDKVIYKYFDMYDFSENDIEITTESMWFSMLPNKPKTSMSLEIGTGCVTRHTLELNSSNKEKLLEFWLKWKEFKKNNPDAYSKKSYSFNSGDVDESAMKKLLSQIECEICTFSDHCDGVFCLKG